ncbi:DNA/RNA non-specific endonuclease [Actinomadura graeca]|uniref:DNA/RNA non-specific endonuclease n=1 Tax=Actinomadura graeca TaxID=2750812 RepID=A0ABX8R402_9ACTN|nr:DNA/RNA non-specific endonuclease [Actinomadura graeca]QXJ25791.1 DNA/RNA non-specific endonuclease [Actinomadura graeca]
MTLQAPLTAAAAALTLIPAAAFTIPALNTASASDGRPRPSATTTPDPCPKFLDKKNDSYSYTIKPSTFTFRTDAQGRPVSATADPLKHLAAKRGTCQGIVGGWGEPKHDSKGHPIKWDGGHLVGNQFGGRDERYNLIPQRQSVNRGVYKNYETYAGYCVSKKSVSVRALTVTLTYPADVTNVTPTQFALNLAMTNTKTNKDHTLTATIYNDDRDQNATTTSIRQQAKNAGCT